MKILLLYKQSERKLVMIDILERVVLLLEGTESFIVPVYWVWKRLGEDLPGLKMTIEELIEELRKDERFKLFEGQEFDLADELRSFVSDQDMDAIGSYRGPRIMLKSRIPSRKEVISLLTEKVNQTFEALKKAWDVRPPGDENVEDQLLEALAKAQRLQRELQKVFSQKEYKNGRSAEEDSSDNR